MTKRRNIFRASVISAAGTGASRVLGALRDIAIAHVFGDSRSADAFWVAWTVPSLFRRFVADEGLTGALIPAVAQTESAGSTREAKQLAGAVLLILLAAGAVIVVGGIFAAPWLVRVIAVGFHDEPETLELTVRLTRWLFPFVFFVSLVSYCEALLNHRNHFFTPKVAPGVVSGCIALAAMLFTTDFDEPVFALAMGALAGGLAHLLVCVPPLIARWGVQLPSPRGFSSPRFRFFLGEMGKVIVIGLLAQVNVVLLRVLATLLEKGSVTQYWYANRLVDLAQGAIAVAVGSALLPAIAEDAAKKDWGQFRRDFAEASMLVAIVLIPAAAFLLGLAEPIVSILFRHGAFSAGAAARTASTLQMLVPFMLALAGINIVKKAYFALDDRTTLLAVGAVGLVITAGSGYLLSTRIGVEGLGIALSLSAALQLGLYLLLLRRKMGEKLGLPALVDPLGRLVLAATPAGAAAWGISLLGEWRLGPGSVTNWLVLAGAGAAAASIYFGLAWALRVEQVRALVGRVLKRLR